MKSLIYLIIIAGLLITGCSSDSGGESGAISGTVSLTVNVKIGRFTFDDYFFGSSSPDEDRVSSLSGAGAYTPLETTLPSDDGTYSLNLPDDVTQMGTVVAWIDTNGDGNFDLGTETGYLPVKNIDGTDYVVHFGYLSAGGASAILVSYGSGQNDDISLVGYTGYNFTLD